MSQAHAGSRTAQEIPQVQQRRAEESSANYKIGSPPAPCAGATNTGRIEAEGEL